MDRLGHVQYVSSVLKPLKDKIRKIFSERKHDSKEIMKINVDFLKQERRLYAIDHEIRVLQGKIFILSKRNNVHISEIDQLNYSIESLRIEEKIIREYIADMNLLLTLSV